MKRAFGLALRITLSFASGLAGPFLLFYLLGRRGLDITGALYFPILAAVGLTSLFTILEGILALRSPRLSRAPRTAYPPAGAIVIAEDGASPAVVRESLAALLALPYLSPLHVVLIWEDPGQLEAAEELVRTQRAGERFAAIAGQGASRGENIRRALNAAGGAFAGVFEAGQIPTGDAFTRAWVWLSHGYDAVQGAVLPRNGDVSMVSRLAAVERFAPGAVACPIAAFLDPDNALCGGNIYLRHELGRTLLAGDATNPRCHTTFDRTLLASGTVPTTFREHWREWTRWDIATLRIPFRFALRRLRRSRSIRGQGLALLVTQIWRPAYVWLSLQVLTVSAYRFWQDTAPHPSRTSLSLAALIALYLFGAEPLRALFAYLLAPREVRRHVGWFLWSAAASVVCYAGLRATAMRAAQLKVALGRRPVFRPVPATSTTQPEVFTVPPLAIHSLVARPRLVTEPESPPKITPVSLPTEPSTPPLSDAARSPAVPSSPAPSPPAAAESTPPGRPIISPSPNERWIVAARRLNDVVAYLLDQLERNDAELHELRQRISALEGENGARAALLAASRPSENGRLGADELAELRELMAALARDPSHIVLLASISQHAQTLARVVDDYAGLRDALSVN